MTKALFTDAVGRAVSRDLSVMELIKVAEAVTAADGAHHTVTLYEAWIRHNADNPLIYAVLFNLGTALMDLGELEGARDALERAVAVNPGFMQAYVNLGRVFERMGDAANAVGRWSVMLEHLAGVNGPAIAHKTTALNQIARVMEEAHQDATALDMLRQSLELDPSQREVAQHYLALRQRQALWPVVEPWDRVGRKALLEAMSPLSMAAYADDPMLQLAAAWNYCRLDVGTPTAAMPVHARAMSSKGRLKIGYLSSDLREHAVGYLTAELFECHDRSKVELFAYYCGISAEDPLKERIRGAFDHWTDIGGLSDDEACARMAEDGIQILVDLNGYTRDARVKLVARRPAPVIVNWLGFPGSMGSPHHHYIIADPFIIPPDQERFYSERVLRLPCYQPTDRKRQVADSRPTRAEAGLPETGVVFCSFNGLHKLTPYTFTRWLAILAKVEGSVLWLLDGPDGAKERLAALAAQSGIDPARLVWAPKLANPFHLARYPLADLFLDSLPYGAHTTASDALWMGVPMLTLAGRSFPARVCASLVTSAGLPELITQDPDTYVARAVELGNAPDRLVELRLRLEEGRATCTLFDTGLLARSLEELFAAMWADAKSGRLPRPDLGNLGVYLDVGGGPDLDEKEVSARNDYEGWWRGRLAAHHAWRPIVADTRLWDGG